MSQLFKILSLTYIERSMKLKMKYLSIEEMLLLIDGANGSSCCKIISDNYELFQTVQGSTNNHQAWKGGYFDHVQEIMNIAIILYESLSSARPLPFTLSDALLICFLHDIEKPWKYELREDGQLHHVPELETKAQAHNFREKKLLEYGIVLTPEQQNGLMYVEGELTDYSSRHRVMGPLAAFCHLADVTSARIWFDHPIASEDPWHGSSRINRVSPL